MVLFFFLVCSGDKDSEEVSPAPTISWLSPADGDSIAVADAANLACAVIVDHFTLQDPAKHNEGQPIGYVLVSVDDTEVLQSGSTNFNLTLEAGSHSLSAQLLYGDGDEVTTTEDALCEEGESGCAEVTQSITVMVQ